MEISAGVANRLNINDEKALDCKEAIDDLKIALSECYQTAFDNIVTHYDSLAGMVDHSKNLLDEAVSQSEAQGLITSEKYFNAQIKAEQELIDLMTKQREELIAKRNEALEAGVIEEGSEAWMEMGEEINGCTESIAEANTNILELNNSIREMEWETFDYLRERVEATVTEANFLIDTLAAEKLHDDNGQLTDEGMATVGLHGMNYNTYMAEADAYAKEIAELDKEIAEFPYDQELLKRRQELLEQQQDMIQAAEDEKEAIKSLVEEGINLELDAFQELIDKYTEALDSAKDLYDYQNNIADKTSEIEVLQKQIQAYKFDTSEEGKATYQKLLKEFEDANKDLEETEYERNISEQKKLLDELYAEYEEVLNSRLDDVDALIKDMIASANENAESINTTINEAASNVGYILSDSLKTVWDTSISGLENTLAVYTEDFSAQMTSVNKSLADISKNVDSMLQASEDLANGTLGTTKQYKTGGLIDYTGPAWVDGTPSKPELMLNASDTENFLELRDWLREFNEKNREVTRLNSVPWNIEPIEYNFVGLDSIKENLRNITTSPVASSMQTSVVWSGDMNLDLDGITNYNEFLNKFKTDKNVEEMIQWMALGRAVGGSPFEKSRYNWG